MIKDSKITAEKVADYFLTKDSMTPKKLQKLVYYAYAWFIVQHHEDDKKATLFEEKPEAWIHGPVFPSLYKKYKDTGWGMIKQKTEKVEFENKEVQNFLDEIWKIFGKYSADQLEYMTHHEDPWIKARGNKRPFEPSTEKILYEDIYTYYSTL